MMSKKVTGKNQNIVVLPGFDFLAGMHNVWMLKADLIIVGEDAKKVEQLLKQAFDFEYHGKENTNPAA